MADGDSSGGSIGVFGGSAEQGHDSSWYLQRVAVVIIIAGIGLLAYFFWYAYRARGPRLGGSAAAWKRIRSNLHKSKADKMEKGIADPQDKMDHQTSNIQKRVYTQSESSSIHTTETGRSNTQGDKDDHIEHIEHPSPIHAREHNSKFEKDPDPNSMLNV